MYRDEKQAAIERAEALTRDQSRLNEENKRLRQALVEQKDGSSVPVSVLGNGAIYSMDVAHVPMDERARLANHQLKPFPVWATAALNVLTFGLFPMIHFGIMNDKLPKAAANDPTSGKAIGFQFIPYFNLYWIFFSSLRFADRISLQLKLRDKKERAPRGWIMAASVLTVFPYGFIIAIPLLWTVAVSLLQHRVNQVAALPASEWSVTPQERHFVESTAIAAEKKEGAKLVKTSNRLGWGGATVMTAGAVLGGMALGPIAAGVAVGVGMIGCISGAIIGQIGRAKQGRVI